MLNKIWSAALNAAASWGYRASTLARSTAIDVLPRLPRPVQSRMTWVVLGVVLFYLQTAQVLTNDQSAEVWRSLQISLSFMVIVAYFRRAIGCFFVVGRWPERIDLISLGIVFSWTSVFFNGTWGMFWRLSGQPAWMVNNDFYQSWVMFNCVAAVLHIIAPNLMGHNVPVADRARLGGAFGLAIVLIALLAVFRPDMSEVAKTIRPYFETTFQERAPAIPPRFS